MGPISSIVYLRVLDSGEDCGWLGHLSSVHFPCPPSALGRVSILDCPPGKEGHERIQCQIVALVLFDNSQWTPKTQRSITITIPTIVRLWIPLRRSDLSAA